MANYAVYLAIAAEGCVGSGSGLPGAVGARDAKGGWCRSVYAVNPCLAQ